MVLISLKGNGGLGLGTLTYLIWIDYLTAVQFVILLAAVMETAMVHHMIRADRKPDAQRIDRICRRFFPFVLYPYMIGCMLLVGNQYVTTGLCVLVFGVAMLCLYIWYKFELGRRKRAAKRAEIAKKLGDLDMNDEAR